MLYVALRDHCIVTVEQWASIPILEVVVQFLVKVILVFDALNKAIFHFNEAIALNDEAADGTGCLQWSRSFWVTLVLRHAS